MNWLPLPLILGCSLWLSSCGNDPVYAGQYRALYAGQSVLLDLEEEGQSVQGTVSTGDLIGRVTGSIDDDQIEGTVESLAFGRVAFRAQRQSDGSLAWTYLQPNGGQGPALQLTFTKGKASASDETPTLDTSLVGQWRRTVGHRVSGARPLDTLNTATDIYCHLAADGTFTYGGAETGFSSPGAVGITQPGSTLRGQWKAENGVLFSKAEGSNQWVPLGQYSVSGNALVLYVGQEKQLWER